MKLTIGIKALNEGKHIESCLRSAVQAAEPWGGEVVLADSGSVDGTVEVARRFPVRIVQLADPSQRSCGAGAQLAFQEAVGEYFYILDGDMILHTDFLAEAIARMDAEPTLAAVGGIVNEVNTSGHEFKIRANAVRSGRSWQPGYVDRLDCGGLYRISAVREVGYFADRNLHAFEEFDLAARLRSRGWKLARIDTPAVDHYGHQTDGYKLLWTRLRSGYAGASGEVLRGAFGQKHLFLVLGGLSHVRNAMAVVAWWLAIIMCAAETMAFWAKVVIVTCLILIPLGMLTARRRSIQLGIYSLAAWNVTAVGLLMGVVRKRTSPRRPLAAVKVSAGTDTNNSSR